MTKHIANILTSCRILGSILLLLFLLPFTLQFVEPQYSFAVVCIIATIAAIQEACYTIKANEEYGI